MVNVTLNGKGEMRRLKIDPTLITPGEVEVLEDLVVAAFNDGKAKVETHVQAEMGKLSRELAEQRLCRERFLREYVELFTSLRA